MYTVSVFSAVRKQFSMLILMLICDIWAHAAAHLEKSLVWK